MWKHQNRSGNFYKKINILGRTGVIINSNINRQEQLKSELSKIYNKFITLLRSQMLPNAGLAFFIGLV